MAVPSPALSRPVTFRFSLPCDPAHVRGSVQKILAFAAEQGWDAKSLMSFELALAEACNNGVEHAGPAGRKHPILLEAVAELTQIEFRVHDHTPGFHWPEKIELPAPESEGGRGLYLITALMDYTAYFRGPDENILVMRKAMPAGMREARHTHTGKLAGSEQVISDLVEELSSCYESLSAIFRYSAEQGHVGDLKAFARRLFDDLLQIVGGEWFVLRLAQKDTTQLAVFAASHPGLELEPLALPAPGQPATAVETEAAVLRQTVWFDAARPAANDPLLKARPDSAGLARPILMGGELMGTLAVGKTVSKAAAKEQGSVFTAAQTNVVNTFADFVAVQIAASRSQEETLRRRLVAHELEIASNIQRSLLPTTLPELPGLSLAAFCRSAREVGGDFYDVFRINDHSVLLVIADVMGKGIPAAMFAAILSTVLRAAPELTQQPAALLTRVSRLLFPELSGVAMFITAQLALVDSKSRKITIANAGHCPLILAGGGSVKTFSPEGMPLGVMADILFEEETVDLPENGRLLLYSDGVTDALNPKGERFGDQRLQDWLAKNADKRRTAEQLQRELVGQLEAHQANAALSDDQTFLVMCAQS